MVHNEESFLLAEETFTPNNDGINDLLHFYYSLETTGYMGNAFVYDLNGAVVKHFVKNELLANEGSYSWNGINESGYAAAAGIYVLLFQVHSSTGDVRTYKKAFALVQT